MNRQDLYPSRVGGQKAELLPRKDPVVYAGFDGPLSAEQVASFERNGFLVLDAFLTPAETRALSGEATELRHDLVSSRAPEVVIEPDSGAVRSVFAVHRSNPCFARLSRHERLLASVLQLLGSEVYVHQSRINYKPGFTGRDFFWHSDFETWHVEDGMPRMRALSASLNLLENNLHNGPLMVVPGSHQEFVACAGSTPERHYESSLRKQENGVPDAEILEDLVCRGGIVAPVGPPGSLLLFDCNTMHGSNGNITPWPRSNAFMVFNSVENTLEAPFSGQAPRPEHIASRDFTPLAPSR